MLATLILAGRVFADPITLTEVNRQIDNKRVRGWVAQIDLADPSVGIVVTGVAPAGDGDAVLTSTDVWAAEQGVQLAVNANYFGTLSGGRADIVGLSASDGQIISGARSFNGTYDPAALILPNRTARIGRFSSADVLMQGSVDAVAGVGASTSDGDPGSLLVDDGVNLGATARVAPADRNPRTGLGVSQDGKRLVIMVIDGRQPGWSDGVTLSQLADLMIEFGSFDAINLDGGGSSSLVYDDGTERIFNRPSDGTFRGVANHLGVRIGGLPDPAVNRPPTRGAWLRPPTNIDSLDPILDALRAAGIQDLYLETFYHGLTTNQSQVFHPRFNFDYLSQAIARAAARSIRLHAWIESAYWSYNGSADYVLNLHPEWKVVDVYGNTNIGDQLGQTFVNLGNPGVQQMMADYCAELAAIPGLWGIQTDYHRFPLDNNTSDNQPAPYSYDSWARSEFMSLYGVDPLVSAANTNGPYWNQFVGFRRERIAQAAGLMHDAMTAVNAAINFSAAVFPTAMTSSSQLVKMQDWPSMASNGFIDTVVPMAYSTSTSGIRSDIRAAVQQAGSTPVVAGLAILTNISRPSISQQLAAARAEGVDDFIFFEASVIYYTPARQAELRNDLLNNGTFQSADFNEDMYVDGLDYMAFYSVYTGTPFVPPPSQRHFDVNGDGWIDAGDEAQMLDQFRRFRFGYDGVVDEDDLQLLLAQWTGPGPGIPIPGPHNLFDLDADGDVDYLDQLRLHRLLTVPIAPDADVDRNGIVDIDDLYAQHQSPIDVNRDGVIDGADKDALEAILRADEIEDMTNTRRP